MCARCTTLSRAGTVRVVTMTLNDAKKKGKRIKGSRFRVLKKLPNPPMPQSQVHQEGELKLAKQKFAVVLNNLNSYT